MKHQLHFSTATVKCSMSELTGFQLKSQNHQAILLPAPLQFGCCFDEYANVLYMQNAKNMTADMFQQTAS